MVQKVDSLARGRLGFATAKRGSLLSRITGDATLHTVTILVFFAALGVFGATDPFDPLAKPEPFSNSSSAPPIDSAKLRDDSARKSIVVKPFKAPAWSWEIAPRFGVVAIDFAERANFATDLSLTSSLDSLRVEQPFPGSDIAWRVGLDFAVRRFDAFRLVIGMDWTHWSAEAIARRDSTGFMVQRSYTGNSYLAGVGIDWLIPKTLLSVDASRDAFLGVRYQAGLGELEGNSTAQGFSSGMRYILGADIANWSRLSISGLLSLGSQSTRSNRTWGDLLWNTPTSSLATWNNGGLGLEFQMRWGPDRDTSRMIQKK